MSEHITHVAVYEDSVRMMKLMPEKFPEAFLHSVEKSYDSGFFASGSRGNHIYAVPLYKETRDRWPNDKSEEVTQRLAAAIGWVTHRAADLVGKPIYRGIEAEGNPKFGNQGCRVYHDIMCFQHVYEGGALSTETPYEYLSPSTFEPHMESTPGVKHLNDLHVESLFTHLWMQEMLTLQSFTYNPEGDMLKYVDALLEHAQETQEDLRDFYAAHQSPDPQEMQKYIHDYGYHFYDKDQPLLKAIKHYQLEGKPDKSIDMEAAIEEAKDGTVYGQMLRLSYDFLQASADFYNKKIDEPTVIKRLRI